ncbi:MAG: cytochrome oxidase small assembly protein [Pseudomonadota bacterium]
MSELATMSQANKPNNVKTGLILATVALVFFVSVFVKHIWLS